MKSNVYSIFFKRAGLTAATLAALVFAGATAEDVLRRHVPAKSGSTIQILGTSTLHDWKIESDQLEGTLNLSLADLQAGAWCSEHRPAVEARIKSESLKSDKAAMDKVAWKALRTREFPEITYHLTEAGVPKASGEGKWSVAARGDMTVAGVKKEVSLTLTVTQHGTALMVSGRLPLKMTDFGIKPPTAMMGAIKSADDVTVIIIWRLEPAA